MAIAPVSRHRFWLTALILGFLAVGGYFLLPAGVQSVAYDVIGLVCGALILLGVRLHRPARPALWYWIAAGQLTTATGDVVWEIYLHVLHQQPFPSVADVFYLGAYPMLATGLILLVRGRQGRRDPAAEIDAAVVATGLSVVFWVFVLHPVVSDATGSVLENVCNTAYPAADVLLLAVMARLFTGGGVTTASTRLLGAAAVMLLLADVGYSVLTRYFSFNSGDPLDALWLLSYVCWGVAALHPSMTGAPAATGPAAPRPVGMRRLVLLTGSSLLAPVMLFLPGMRADPGNWLVVSGGAVVLFLLVAGRMAGFVRQLQRQAAQLGQLARRDPLTGLPNRRQLEEELEAALGTRAACVALLDLTGFKKVNDQLGHNVGDLLLVEVGRRLSRAAGGTASVARLGGDEFAVLSERGPEHATAVAERITRSLAVPIEAAGHHLLVGANIGLASAAGLSEPLEALRRADVAMYAAKERGEPSRWYGPELDGRPRTTGGAAGCPPRG